MEVEPGCVNHLLLWNEPPPNLAAKLIHMYHLTVFEGQKWRHGLAGLHWLSVSFQAAIVVLAGAAVMSSSTREPPSPRSFMWLLVACRSSLAPGHRPSSLPSRPLHRAVYNMAAGFHQSGQVEEQRAWCLPTLTALPKLPVTPKQRTWQRGGVTFSSFSYIDYEMTIPCRAGTISSWVWNLL